MKQVYESDVEETIKMMAEKYNVNEKTTYFLQPFTDVHLSKELPAQNGLVGRVTGLFLYTFCHRCFYFTYCLYQFCKPYRRKVGEAGERNRNKKSGRG